MLRDVEVKRLSLAARGLEQLGQRPVRGRVLKQLERAPVVDRGAPARILEADRGAREQLRVSEPPRELGGAGEGLQCARGIARAMACPSEFELRLRALGGVGDPKRERRL